MNCIRCKKELNETKKICFDCRDKQSKKRLKRNKLTYKRYNLDSLVAIPNIGIYKITNLQNNKSYIGESGNLKKRIISHKINSSNIYLKKSIQGFGIQRHSLEILSMKQFSILERKILEKYLQKKVAYHNLFNIEKGFEFEKPLNAEYKEACYNLCAYFYELRIEEFEEMKDKLYFRNQASIYIVQKDVEGKQLNKFSSVIEAAHATHTHPGNISKVLSGKRSKAGGYKWSKK